MRRSKIIKFAGEELTVKELTVSEIAGIMDGLDNFTPHILDVLMDMPIPSPAFFMAIGKDAKAFDLDVAPSELSELYKAVIEVNPTLAATMERLKQAGSRAMKSGALPSG